MDIEVKDLTEIINEARQAANEATVKYLGEYGEGYPCGFAWVSIYKFDGKKLKGNTRIGKALKAAGVDQDYNRVFQIWNPSGHGTQNVDAKEAGARAAADVFNKYGFQAYPGSRLD